MKMTYEVDGATWMEDVAPFIEVGLSGSEAEDGAEAVEICDKMREKKRDFVVPFKWKYIQYSCGNFRVSTES